MRVICLTALVACSLLTPGFSGGLVPVQGKKEQERQAREERQDHFERWLNEDVIHIILEEERTVFDKLTTPEEKEQFIEQFWLRRDADRTTAENEFKEEHYRRIAYANDNFSSGLSGWKVDRGRIYIIHGPPAEIERYPSGGVYQRPFYEGGGTTSTFPFEIWRYRHIEGIGNDVELEFVDKSLTGEYRLTMVPDEKDAFLRVPGSGKTVAEQMRLATKKDRPYFSPGNSQRYPFMNQRAKDNPFVRYETYARVQRPLQIKYKDLQELVEVGISYETLPLATRQDYFRLNPQQVLVPITIQVENKNLTFKQNESGYVAEVAVYGLVTSIANQVVAEFENDLIISYPPEVFQEALQTHSLYQKHLILDPKIRYKIDLVVKDLQGTKVGAVRQAIVSPSFPKEKLVGSSLILSQFIRPLGEIPKDDQMFVLGDVWIHPSLKKVFSSDGRLGVYLQIYNAALDQTDQTPSLEISYKISSQNGEIFTETLDQNGQSIQFYSPRRVVLIKGLPLRHLKAGRYRVQVLVQDRISDETVTAEDSFVVVKSLQASPG